MPSSQITFRCIRSYYSEHRGRELERQVNLNTITNATICQFTQASTNNEWLFIVPNEDITLKSLLENAETIEKLRTLSIGDDKNNFIVFLSLDINTGFDENPSSYLEDKKIKESVFEAICLKADMAFNKFKTNFFENKPLDKFFAVNFINEVIPHYFF